MTGKYAFPNALAPLTPEVLVEVIQIDVPQGLVAVQGYALNLRTWTPPNGRSFVFGELSLGTAVIAFRVPAEAAPDEGDSVVLEGYLKFSADAKGSANFRKGNWRIVLTGHVVGKWTPREQSAPVEAPIRDSEQVPIEKFFESAKLNHLLILASDTAKKDILRELSAADVKGRPQFLRIKFDDPPALVKLLGTLPSDYSYGALAVARGGGEGLDVIGNSAEVVRALIAAQVPFYSAIGHASDVVVMDRYADQTFHTPTALGSRIGQSIRANYRREMEARERDDLHQQIGVHLKTLSEAQQSLVHWRKWALGLGAIVLLLALILWQVLKT